jgi:hypothetical protein
VKKVMDFIGLTIGGWIGWWVGAFVSVFVAFLVSVVGIGLGMYAIRRVTKGLIP